MKKFVLMCLAALLMVALAVPASAAGKEVGKVVSVKGDVKVARVGEGASKPLAVNSPIYLKDTITTGGTGRVKMMMNDRSVLTLGKKAKMVVREYTVTPAKQERKSVLGLVTGTLRSLVTKTFSSAGSKFEVHTPTAVAGVRGTHFITKVQRHDKTLVVCLKGRVFVRNRDLRISNEQTVTPGMGSYVEEDKEPTKPFTVLSSLVNSLVNDTSEQGGQTRQGEQVQQKTTSVQQEQAVEEAETEDEYAIKNTPEPTGNQATTEEQTSVQQEDTETTTEQEDEASPETFNTTTDSIGGYTRPGASIPFGGAGGGGAGVSPNQP